ncbi:MAG: hypothetical protein U0903_07295 [Planctomycetales bacterium]
MTIFTDDPNGRYHELKVPIRIQSRDVTSKGKSPSIAREKVTAAVAD